ncbi:SipW-dependent-type signal peptide-containing protein, partial [Halopenitus sp. H-Gu1]|uniref:SipW-dependent-type signal peptide-containing protein n=1 Tax=Halopenitus sp. H-Gu1 TaxID=3242697 RepID=UPI00359E09C6
MSNQGKIGLSRRRVLASMGAIGVASAGAGLGTTAYFSDEESFTGNTLTAGELDLKVDWQQTYNGPMPNGDGVGEHPVNAYPDTAVDGESYGDGLQDLDGVHYSGAGDVEPVFNAAEIPACCDCEDDEYYVAYGGESYCIEPVSSVDSIEDFYDYTQAGGSIEYSSQNDDIQREDTSVMFLHEDEAGGLSLVIVNDAYTNEDGGGAASVTIEGAPSSSGWLVGSGDWHVKDDVEGNENQGFEQYEEWEVDWAWGTDRTDGGAIGYLEDDFALRISAAFNQAADRNPLGPGQIEELVVLSGGSGFGSSDEIVLEDVNEAGDNVDPITIHSACGIDSGAELDVPAVFQSENYPGQEHLVELDDVKPGDEGEITFSLHLCDNP